MTSVVIDLTKIIINYKGEVIKDRIEADPMIPEKNSPDMTLGSLLAGALSIGIQVQAIKKTLECMQFAQRIQTCIKEKGGQFEIDEKDLSRLENCLMLINHPMFLTPVYGAPMMEALEKAKMDLVKIKYTPKMDDAPDSGNASKQKPTR